jgi:hypothetical protein
MHSLLIAHCSSSSSSSLTVVGRISSGLLIKLGAVYSTTRPTHQHALIILKTLPNHGISNATHAASTNLLLVLHAVGTTHFVLHLHELHLLVGTVGAESGLLSSRQGRIGAHDSGLGGALPRVLAGTLFGFYCLLLAAQLVGINLGERRHGAVRLRRAVRAEQHIKLLGSRSRSVCLGSSDGLVLGEFSAAA